mmetsp:Transcript_11988/g.32790  ORF Transcript_11988/g.32790 Transcript_11988/m.32790 type:complete len:251 (-) Transcript_11988:420-1172(-)
MQGTLLSKLGTHHLTKQLGLGKRKESPSHTNNVRHNHFKEIEDRGVNVVHISRRSGVPSQELQDLLATKRGFQAHAKIPVHEPELAIRELLLGLSEDQQQPHIINWLREDIAKLCQDFAEVWPPADGLLNAKLQHIQNTPCSRWHADHVALRLLCSYFGPGTLYMLDRYVSRSVEEDGHPRVSVSDKDEIHAEEAQPGDILLLKGHVWPGNMNCGVVHKSPLLDNCGCGEEHPVPEVTRLVLTIDTATDW